MRKAIPPIVGFLCGVTLCVQAAMSQTTQPPSPTLPTGPPNLYYPAAPPLLTGASSTDPLLGSPAQRPADPNDDPGPCPPSGPPCIITNQNNNSRTGGVYQEPVAWPWSEELKSFQWQLSTNPSNQPQYNFLKTAQAPNPFSSGSAGYPGGTLALTVNPSDPSGDGVVWAVATASTYLGSACTGEPPRCPGDLLAYSLASPGSPTPGALTQLWPGGTLPPSPFLVAPYAVPTAVNGKVYIPTYGLYDGNGYNTLFGLAVYGFCSAGGCLTQ